jgi:recombination protein RecA
MPRGRPKKKLTDKLVESRKDDSVMEDKKMDLIPNPGQNRKEAEPPERIDTKEFTERKAKLEAVLREINKVIPGSVNYANTIEARERLSFGYKCLDDITGGGIVYGNTTTIWGSKGCGKSTIAYKLLATAQKNHKIAAYLDVERSYDATWAKKFGVDTESLVYVACKTAEEVLDTVIKLCKSSVVDVIVLDSIQGLSPHGEQYEGKGEKDKSVQNDTMALLARKLSQFFRMATPYISDAKCALVLIGQARMDLGSFIKMETLSGGHALMHNSRLILRLRRGQKADAPTEKVKNEDGKTENVQIGFDLCIKVDKSQIQNCIEGTEIHVPFLYTDGIQ